MKFFSEIDVKNGKVASEYPVWYFDVHMDNLNEEVASNKRRLARGEVPPDQVGALKAEIERGEVKLKEIEKATPKLSDDERDKLWKLYKEELCPKISDSLFTRSQMQRGVASGHEEAARMIKCMIPVTGTVADMILELGGKIENGKTSRNDLARVFKLVGKLLGEATNIEILRKD